MYVFTIHIENVYAIVLLNYLLEHSDVNFGRIIDLMTATKILISKNEEITATLQIENKYFSGLSGLALNCILNQW